FSALYPILIEPLPYPHADRLVMLSTIANRGNRIGTAYGTFLELAARSRSFELLGVADRWQPVLTGGEFGRRLDGQRVSPGYLRVLGATPAAGRLLNESDDRVGGPRVVVLSDALARQQFDGAPRTAVGRQVMLNGNAYEVVGVLLPDFENALAP